MAWEGVAQWAARALWSAGTAACLLASDLPVGIEVLRRVAHYGKLRAEVSLLPPAGAPRLQARLAQMSLPPRAVWTAYYVGGAAINLGCLAWEVRGAGVGAAAPRYASFDRDARHRKHRRCR
jgi:hypothetical protein